MMHFKMRFNYKKATLICGLVMAAAITVSACSSKKYENIDLTGFEVSESANDVGETTGEAAAETMTPEISLITDPSMAVQAADAGAVAGTSPLDSTITTDNGFVDANETVYVTDNRVNIRSGCGKDFGIVVQLNKGDSIKRTGYSEGWSRVVYQDQVCYAVSDYLTTVNPEGEGTQNVQALSNTTPMNENDGSAISNGRIIAIDAGHQAKGDPEKEPVGPGSSTMKAKVASGTEGVSTKLPEYKLTLAVSQKVKRILEERGYQVVMIRETNDVNISNAERAKIANKSGASAFVRIHANSLENSTVAGVLTMCQTSGNPYNGELHGKSYSLSRKITDSISSATGFKNRGVQETDSMSGINWCTIPVSIVEMGFMSNPEEDQKMAQEEYQEMIAAGIADGIDAYFAE